MQTQSMHIPKVAGALNEAGEGTWHLRMTDPGDPGLFLAAFVLQYNEGKVPWRIAREAAKYPRKYCFEQFLKHLCSQELFPLAFDLRAARTTASRISRVLFTNYAWCLAYTAITLTQLPQPSNPIAHSSVRINLSNHRLVLVSTSTSKPVPSRDGGARIQRYYLKSCQIYFDPIKRTIEIEIQLLYPSQLSVIRVPTMSCNDRNPT